MESQALINIAVFLALLLVLMNAILTKEVLVWVPSPGKRAVLILCIWLFPPIGSLVAYFSAELTWVRKTSNQPDGPSSIAGGLLGLDSFFNPGSRHTLETVQEEHRQIRESGEPEKAADPNKAQ